MFHTVLYCFLLFLCYKDDGLIGKDGVEGKERRSEAEDTQLADLTVDIERLKDVTSAMESLAVGMPIALDDISHLSWGCRRSPYFQELLQRRAGGGRMHADDQTWRCFSVAYHTHNQHDQDGSGGSDDGGGGMRWLDFACSSDESLAAWYIGLQSFISVQSQSPAHGNSDAGGGGMARERHTHVTSRQLMLWVLHAKVAAKTAKAMLEPQTSASGRSHSDSGTGGGCSNTLLSDNDTRGAWLAHLTASKLSFEEGQGVEVLSVVAWLKGLFIQCNKARLQDDEDVVDLSLYILAMGYELNAPIEEQLLGWTDMHDADRQAIQRVHNGLIRELRRKVGADSGQIPMRDTADLERWFGRYLLKSETSKRRECSAIHPANHPAIHPTIQYTSYRNPTTATSVTR